MKKYLILLVISLSPLSANDSYSILGINVNKKSDKSEKKVKKVSSTISIHSVKITKKIDSSYSKILEHVEIQKISKETTLYGMGVDYKVFPKIELSLNLLTEVDVKRPSKMIKNRVANIKMELSI